MPRQPGPYRRPGKEGWYVRLLVPDTTKKSGYRYTVKSLRTTSLTEARKRFPLVYADLQAEHGLRAPRREALRSEVENWFESLGDRTVSMLEAVEGISRFEVDQDSHTGEFKPTPLQEEIGDALRKRDSREIGPTWQEALQAWESRRTRAKGAPSSSSRRSIERAVEELRELDMRLEPKNLTEERAWRWVRHQESIGNQPTTIRTKLAMLKAMTKACFKVKLLKADPLGEMEYDVAPSKSYRSPTSEEYKRIWANLDCLEEGDKRLLTLLMLTGMRLDEAASRFGRHLTDQDGIKAIEICELGGETPWKPKTAASARTVVWPEGLMQPSTGLEEQLFSRCRYRSGKFGKTASQRIKQQLWKSAGLPIEPTLTIHSLRAGYIDALRAVQCPLEIEEAIVGHSKAQSSVHRGYGNGYPLAVIAVWMNKATGQIQALGH
jgi:integrase